MNIIKPRFITSIFVSMLCISALLSACNKSNPSRNPLRSDVPVIESISPTSGPAGTIVTIYGKNLGYDSTEVKVNGKRMANKSSSDTKLVITIEDSTGTGAVVVKNAHGQATGPVFNYTLTNSYKVVTFAGNGTAGYTDGMGTDARFHSPYGIAIDAADNLYIADQQNESIRKISPAGMVTTLAGNGTAGFKDGQGSSANFYRPTDLVLDPQNNLYVADQYNQRIRKITANGLVTTYAGPGSVSTAGVAIQLSFPVSITIDKQGNLYVGEKGEQQRIRLITTSLNASVFAGGNTIVGSSDGTGTGAQFNVPYGLVIDALGANLYVSEFGNSLIRKVTIPDAVVTSPFGSGAASFADGIGKLAAFSQPAGITRDASGNLYVADYGNNRIRKILVSQLEVKTLAGNGTTGLANGDALSAATFNGPYGIAADAQGNLYVTDAVNNCIRKMTPYQY